MKENDPIAPETPEVPRVEFRYLKSTAFRVIHADGAWGGLTPRGDIHMVLYNERPTIPDVTANELNPDGSLGKEIGKVWKEGMVREVEVDVIMSYPTAKALLTWLSTKVESIDKALKDAVTQESEKDLNSEGVQQ